MLPCATERLWPGLARAQPCGGCIARRLWLSSVRVASICLAYHRTRPDKRAPESQGDSGISKATKDSALPVSSFSSRTLPTPRANQNIFV